MKEITLDWETYTKEQEDNESNGVRQGIHRVEKWALSDKKLWELLDEWNCCSVERLYWKDLAKALGREEELKKLWRKLPDMAKVFLVVFLLLTVVMLLACTSFLWNNYPDDNLIEEMIEGMIKEKTGLDLDLSPHSEESLIPHPLFK